jgi:hypothetical protein
MISMEATSPRTAPIREATAPRAPGRSGNSIRTRKVAIQPGYVRGVNDVFRVRVLAVTGAPFVVAGIRGAAGGVFSCVCRDSLNVQARSKVAVRP